MPSIENEAEKSVDDIKPDGKTKRVLRGPESKSLPKAEIRSLTKFGFSHPDEPGIIYFDVLFKDSIFESLPVCLATVSHEMVIVSEMYEITQDINPDKRMESLDYLTSRIKAYKESIRILREFSELIKDNTELRNEYLELTKPGGIISYEEEQLRINETLKQVREN